MWKSYEAIEKFRLTRMYSLFEANYESTYAFHGETHPFWECVYVMEGKICVGADDRIYNMEKGQIVFHKPLEIHKFNVEGRCDAKLLIFSFEAEGDISFFENKVFVLSPDQLKIIGDFISALRKYTQVPIPTMTAENRFSLHSMYLDGFLRSRRYVQQVISYIHLLLLSLSTDSVISGVSRSGQARIFSDVVKYMNDNIAGSPSISDLAKACNSSPTALKRIFAKYSGLSIHKYFLILKMGAASQMLKADYSVSETADALGFSSQGYFSRVFKRETGYYPTEYKKYQVKTEIL